ncbi:hypothetical protein [Luteococcus sediminum]
MNPMQTSVAVMAVLTVLFCRPFQGQLSLTAVLVALVAALALVLGAWCAPATGRPFALSGDAAWRRAKNVQLVVGGSGRLRRAAAVHRHAGNGRHLGDLRRPGRRRPDARCLADAVRGGPHDG